jgi:hypothetical protein
VYTVSDHNRQALGETNPAFIFEIADFVLVQLLSREGHVISSGHHDKF